jgi:hypothetical protein
MIFIVMGLSSEGFFSFFFNSEIFWLMKKNQEEIEHV